MYFLVICTLFVQATLDTSLSTLPCRAGAMQVFWISTAMVMIDDGGGAWRYSPPGKIIDVLRSLVKLCFGQNGTRISPTCSYLLQSVKPLETTEHSCQK